MRAFMDASLQDCIYGGSINSEMLYVDIQCVAHAEKYSAKNFMMDEQESRLFR